MSHAALVLAGGGGKGAWGAAAAREIWNHYRGTENQIDLVCGTSVGALNAAKLVQDGPDALVDLWSRLSEHDIFRRPFGATTAALRLMAGSGLFDSEPLWHLIERELDAKKIGSGLACLLVHAVSLEPPRLVRWSEHSRDLLRGIYASASLPLVFPPVELRGCRYIDGGVIANAPLASAVEQGATLITVVRLSPRRLLERLPYDVLPDAELPPLLGPLDSVSALVESMMNAQLERDLHFLEERDKLRAETLDPLGQVPRVKVQVLGPESDLGGALEFDREHLDELITRGTREASAWLAEIESQRAEQN